MGHMGPNSQSAPGHRASRVYPAYQFRSIRRSYRAVTIMQKDVGNISPNGGQEDFTTSAPGNGTIRAATAEGQAPNAEPGSPVSPGGDRTGETGATQGPPS